MRASRGSSVALGPGANEVSPRNPIGLAYARPQPPAVYTSSSRDRARFTNGDEPFRISGMTSTVSETSSRAAIYWLLARLWAEPASRTLPELIQQPLASTWQKVGGWLPNDCGSRILDELDEAYCRLFVGPTEHLPPIQSVWETGELAGSAATGISQFNEIIGDGPAWEVDLLPDHLGNLLARMSQFVAGLEAVTANDDRAAAEDLIQSFRQQHLTWVDRFLTFAIKRADCDFYRSVAEVTQQFLKSEPEIFIPLYSESDRP